ncbi:uncharacterized protein [Diabrotica undecimpunctata]|uniref:uncharacterized protein n=1 Tax=Diabrotica undecimpunctata TaxID=50387 RepID=UPI003B63DDF0
MVSCAKRSCNTRSNTHKKSSGISFHRFPKDPERRDIWIKFVNRGKWKPNKYSVLCSKHFLEADMDRTSLSSIRLRDSAVPITFITPQEIMNSCTPSTLTSSEVFLIACHICSKIFKNVELLNLHIKRMHTIDVSRCVEEKMVVELTSGVSPSRILEDVRKLETPKQERLALLTSKDLTNLSKKYNIHKTQDQNDMGPIALKVQECNANNKNYAFLSKKEGEQHDALKKEDWALESMNSAMEDKLGETPNIICMDGTHDTRGESRVHSKECVSTNSVLDHAARCLGETSIIRSTDEEKMIEFVIVKLEETDAIQEKTTRSVQRENLINFMDELDDESFTKLHDTIMRDFQGTKRKAKEDFQEKAKNITKKLKMEKE